MPDPNKRRLGESAAAQALTASKTRRERAHDFSNELAVILGYASLAGSALRRLAETAEADAASELRSIVTMIEKITESAEQGKRLLSLSPAPPASAVAPGAARQYRILAIDDSPPLLALMEKILTQAGYAVEAFGDARAAAARFAEAPRDFDLVITDAVMPALSGAALGEKIRAIRPDMPIVVCTGSAGFCGGHESAATEWAQAVIHKPYHPRALATLARQIIEGA